MAETGVYPNPVEGTLNFTTNVTGAVIDITNLQSGVRSMGKVKNNTIDVSDLKAGVYSITITKDGQRIVKRFIKK
jgi:chitinase